MILSEVTWLQVENTTKCNAWCPACSRNKNGFGLKPWLILEDLATSRLEEVLDLMPNLDTVQFCGTHGDTMAASNVMEHIELTQSRVKKLQIHTHGGLRSESWWSDLGKMLSKTEHDVWFGIDGLKGVHEIHRQGTDFDKVIANATAFIQAGGWATWQFIPWAHNEHQIKDCIRLSQRLGFKKFKFVTSVRENFSARDWKTGQPIEFRPWSRSGKTNPNRIITQRTELKVSDCRHVAKKTLYLNANGKFSPCCYLNFDREVEGNVLPDIEQEILFNPHKLCLQNCGNGAKLDSL